jgi:hypothetical protein
MARIRKDKIGSILEENHQRTLFRMNQTLKCQNNLQSTIKTMKIPEARVRKVRDRDLNIVMKDPVRIKKREDLKVKAPEKKE